MSKWTRFMDMHSGGEQKEKWSKILIEAPESEAVVIFYNRFGHSPSRVTCTCCGEDYAVDDHDSLELATAYDRRCKWVNGEYDLSSCEIALDDYISREDVLVIRAGEIKDSERAGNVPESGYVWVD